MDGALETDTEEGAPFLCLAFAGRGEEVAEEGSSRLLRPGNVRQAPVA